ncbi:unnamed protein product [Owenia fusiformis]|uniref:Midasin n=1 Tax=Owenia fusiformis TaxID=6347 RepID=A0A8S4PNV7_OWEFU|nr:unnamed protein product [Owenia fusiformis]
MMIFKSNFTFCSTRQTGQYTVASTLDKMPLDTVAIIKTYRQSTVILQPCGVTVQDVLYHPDSLSSTYDRSIVYSIFNPEKIDLQRYVIPIPLYLNVDGVIANDNITKIAILTSQVKQQGDGNNKQSQLLVFDLKSTVSFSAKVAFYPESAVMKMSWLNDSTIGVVTSNAVFHYNVLPTFKQDPVQETPILSFAEQFNEVTNYEISYDGKFALLEAQLVGNTCPSFYICDTSTKFIQHLDGVKGCHLQRVLTDQTWISAIVYKRGKWIFYSQKLEPRDQLVDRTFNTAEPLDVYWPEETCIQFCHTIHEISTQYYLISQEQKVMVRFNTDCRIKESIHSSFTDFKIAPNGDITALNREKNDTTIYTSVEMNPNLHAPKCPLCRHIPHADYNCDAKSLAILEMFYSHNNLSGHILVAGDAILPNFVSRELFMTLDDNRHLYRNAKHVTIAGIAIPKQDLRHHEHMKENVPSTTGLVLTPNTERNLKSIIHSVVLNHPVIIEGSTSGGKTASVAYCASITNSPLLRFNLTPQSSISDLLGTLEFADNDDHEHEQVKEESYMKQDSSSSGPNLKLVFRPGMLSRAVKEGYWLLLDEANIAGDGILRVIEDLANSGVLQIRSNMLAGQTDALSGCIQYRQHPNFRLFLTQNPPDDNAYRGTRNIFSESLLSHFKPVVFQTIPLYPDCYEIVKSTLVEDTNTAHVLIALFEEVNEVRKRSEQNIVLLTMRDLLHACAIIKQCSRSDVSVGLFYLFSQHMTADLKKKVHLLVQRMIGPLNNIVTLKRDMFPPTTALLEKHTEMFQFFNLCHQTKRPGLLVGENYSGKLTSITTWAEIMKIETEIYYTNAETTSEDLIGKIQPQEEGTSPFLWTDGPVTRAMKRGRCLVLCGIDQPDETVLESMNPILEARGNRRIEIGNKLIDVHDDFFVISTYNKSDDMSLKLTPALLSRYLCFDMPSGMTGSDITSLVRAGITSDNFRRNVQIKVMAYCKRGDASLGNLCRFLRASNKIVQKLDMTDTVSMCGIVDKHLDTLVKILFENKGMDIKTDDIDTDSDELNQMIAWFEKNSYCLQGTSRIVLASHLLQLMQMNIPVLLQGVAGVGKTSIVKCMAEYLKYKRSEITVFSFNKETSISDLMGCYMPAKGRVMFKEGPLCLALKEGWIFVADELNLAQQEVVAYLTPLLNNPKRFLNSVNGKKYDIHDRFSFIATQNPPEYAGRNVLPQAVQSRLVKLEIQDYSKEEIINIMLTREKTTTDKPKLKKEELHKRMQHVVQEVMNAGISPTPTLRHYLKLMQRLIQRGHIYQRKSKWKEFIALHINVLFNCQSEQMKENVLIPVITFENHKWNFKLCFKKKPKVFLEASWPAKTTALLDPVLPGENLLICKVAIALMYHEPIVIEGPTSFKSTSVLRFASMVDLRVHETMSVNSVYMSSLTGISDLVGSIEPHSGQSYTNRYAYQMAHLLQNECSTFMVKQPTSKGVHDVIDFYCNFVGCVKREYNISRDCDESKLVEILIGLQDNAPDKLIPLCIFAVDILDQLKNEMKNGQGFPFCERGLLQNIRFGGIALLKDINLPDQAVVECLNSITELEPVFTHPNSVKMPVVVHENLYIVATISKPMLRPVSPALRSRYTFISVEAPDYRSAEVDQFLADILVQRDKLTTEDESKRVIQSYKENYFTRYRDVTVNDLIKWTHFCNIATFDENLDEKLKMGNQILFHDRSSSNEMALEGSNDMLVHDDESSCWYLRASGVILPNEPSRVEEDLVVTDNVLNIVSKLLIGHYTGHVMNLLGPPGVGKSKITEVFARHVLKRQFIRISCSSCLSADDLFGTFTPCLDGNKMMFRYEEGALAKAMGMNEGCVVLLDEINLAPSDVLSTLIGILKHPREKPYIIHGNEYSTEKVQFICAMNPPSVGGGRQDLHPSLMKHLTTVSLQCLTDDEIKTIIRQRYHEVFKLDTENVIQTHFGLITKIQASNTHDEKCNVSFNLRDIEKVSAIYASMTSKVAPSDEYSPMLIVKALCLVYAERFSNMSNKQLAKEFIRKTFKIQEDVSQHIKVKSESGVLYWCEETKHKPQHANQFKTEHTTKEELKGSSIPDHHRLTYTNEFVRRLDLVNIAVNSQCAVILTGPPVSGKTTIVQELARLKNKRLYTIAMNADMEINDLIGGFAPVNPEYLDNSFRRQIQKLANTLIQAIPVKCVQYVIDRLECGHINEVASTLVNDSRESVALIQQIQHLLDRESNLEKSAFVTGFRFIPGPIIDAMREGSWILLDNVDLARPEVVERINSLVERDACLFTLEINGESENNIQKHTPNEGFYLICTANSTRDGRFPLSEPFRNRFIEIYIDKLEDTADASDITGLLNGIEENELCNPRAIDLGDKVKTVHERLRSYYENENKIGICGYKLSYRNIQRLFDTVNATDIIAEGLEEAYGAAALGVELGNDLLEIGQPFCDQDYGKYLSTRDREAKPLSTAPPIVSTRLRGRDTETPPDIPADLKSILLHLKERHIHLAHTIDIVIEFLGDDLLTVSQTSIAEVKKLLHNVESGILICIALAQ